MSKPLIIGHRGASALAPENTMAAFRMAYDAGADGIEFDVRLSADGIPVVIHDEDLRRTCGLNKRVSDCSLDELKSFEFGSWFSQKTKTERSYDGEPILTLKELLESFPEHFVLYLEMKCESSQRDELVETCSDLLKSTERKGQVIVESFDLKAIRLMKQIDSAVTTAALFEPSLSHPPLIASQKIIERAKESGANEIALHHRLASRRLVELARDGGFRVVVWTVDETHWVATCRQLGIDALITNQPAVLLDQRDRILCD